MGPPKALQTSTTRYEGSSRLVLLDPALLGVLLRWDSWFEGHLHLLGPLHPFSSFDPPGWCPPPLVGVAKTSTKPPHAALSASVSLGPSGTQEEGRNSTFSSDPDPRTLVLLTESRGWEQSVFWSAPLSFCLSLFFSSFSSLILFLSSASRSVPLPYHSPPCISFYPLGFFSCASSISQEKAYFPSALPSSDLSYPPFPSVCQKQGPCGEGSGHSTPAQGLGSKVSFSALPQASPLLQSFGVVGS